ncbi:MAG: tripartite tricarboxylate transporter substrate binding protein [Sulfuricaulis sp.]|nr:tripartite tricarboxylate transporter substrate binding protein [Sulfuricaulis sp.]
MITRCMMAVLVTVCTGVSAQTFPDKPVRIVVGYAPGGATDLVGRILADGVTELLGQSVIIDNRAGAGGAIGMQIVAKAAPDGYTLALCTIGNCAIMPSLVKTAGYDLIKDFLPVMFVGGFMNVFVVTPSFPAKSVKELVALAKASPGKIVFGSGGVGNSPHMTVELLKYRAGIDMLHVPYKGSGPAIIDVVGGQINMMVENEPSLVSHVKGGRLRAIAVTGMKRSAQLADVPTMIEQGYEDFVVEAWNGFLAPARTPRPAIDRLNAAFNTALQNPRIRKRLEEVSVNIAGGTPQDFGAHLKAEIDKWASVIKANNITVE